MTGRSWEGRYNSGQTPGSCSSTVKSSLLKERWGEDQPSQRGVTSATGAVTGARPAAPHQALFDSVLSACFHVGANI